MTYFNTMKQRYIFLVEFLEKNCVYRIYSGKQLDHCMCVLQLSARISTNIFYCVEGSIHVRAENPAIYGDTSR